MSDVIDLLLEEADKARRKGHLTLAQACQDGADRIGLLQHEVANLQEALRQCTARLHGEFPS